ncbi:NAD(P)-binding protein [Alkalimonas sp. MEB108]|uniref:NAD(P)-binding protein n=1 Tax=Alkalimonas cellulosilytica TaxID=3058395 RepID=A0ABU7J0K2_9GAMM|nr:FAD-dependent oxidoreductase [Alkalimonas sp. MEB108]MEE1999868.1 NAD(P)-binding protein [Alkalimonas sp. MEB108]
MRVAIVGAGVAGLSCGQALLAAGAEVHWFDKSRATAGRASAKRVFGSHVDLGAQYFTVRQLAFRQQVDLWEQQQLVAPWPAQLYCFANGHLQQSNDDIKRYVGLPAMHSPWRVGLSELAFTLNCRIQVIEYQQGWQLQAEDGRSFSGFDALVLALPPAQAAELLAQDDDLRQQVPTSLLQPCQAIALELSEPITHPATAVFVKNRPVSWLANNSDKPGRKAERQHWVLHFTPEFSQQHLTATADELSLLAQAELSLLFQQDVQVEQSVHQRWLYAIVDAEQPAPGVLISRRFPCVLTGDWCLGGRVENAWLAGQQAAKAVLHV